jgi:hypothetical protein
VRSPAREGGGGKREAVSRHLCLCVCVLFVCADIVCCMCMACSSADVRDCDDYDDEKEKAGSEVILSFHSSFLPCLLA